jgi:Na+/proline symporter
MFVAVVLKLNDKGIGLFDAFDQPALHGHDKPLVGPYGTVFLLAFLFIKLFEYNGGMLNQAQRYMATGSAREAERSARLSAVLWLVWPVVLFFPMWMSPLLVHAQKPDGSDSYGLMTEQLLPHGLLGLVIVGFFSHTMAMCSSDANAIAAVFTRDVAPVVSRAARAWNERSGLIAARVTTVIFLGLSMAVATQVNSPTFKDIITVVIKWVAGLMGPIAIPMMLGLLRQFRRSGPTAALVSWAMGLLAFWLVNYPISWNVDGGVPLQYQVSIPLAVSLVLYILVGYLKPEDTPDRLGVIERINTDDDSAAVAVPAPAGEVEDVTGRTTVKD